MLRVFIRDNGRLESDNMLNGARPVNRLLSVNDFKRDHDRTLFKQLPNMLSQVNILGFTIL